MVFKIGNTTYRHCLKVKKAGLPHSVRKRRNSWTTTGGGGSTHLWKVSRPRRRRSQSPPRLREGCFSNDDLPDALPAVRPVAPPGVRLVVPPESRQGSRQQPPASLAQVPVPHDVAVSDLATASTRSGW